MGPNTSAFPPDRAHSRISTGKRGGTSMVHSLDDSPLALLRLARSEAEAELRRSLAKASMLALTLCVSVLLARALFFPTPEFRIIPTPTWFPPDDHVVDTPPIPQTDYVPPRPPEVIDPNSTFRPVDQEVDLPKVEDPPPYSPPAVGNGSGAGEVRPGNGDTPAPPVIEPDPDPTTQFVEQLPNPLKKVVPAYPPIAREAGMEGKVTV